MKLYKNSISDLGRQNKPLNFIAHSFLITYEIGKKSFKKI